MLSIIFAAVLGACLGSFANVLVIRLYEESSLMGRSECPNCKTTIKPRHLVPIFSWLFLKGKCAYCGKKIHIQYPLVELAGAILLVVTVMRHPLVGPSLGVFIFETFLVMALLVIVVMDIRWKELPLEVMVVTTVIALAWNAFAAWHGGHLMPWGTSVIIGLAFPFAFFGLQWLLSKGRWLGSGDIWFGMMMGAILGWPLVGIAIYLAYIIGGVAVMLLLLAGVIRRGVQVPFAPALAAGLVVALWYGPAIMEWLRYVFP